MAPRSRGTALPSVGVSAGTHASAPGRPAGDVRGGRGIVSEAQAAVRTWRATAPASAQLGSGLGGHRGRRTPSGGRWGRALVGAMETKGKPESSPHRRQGCRRGCGRLGDMAWTFLVRLGAWAAGRLLRCTVISADSRRGTAPRPAGGETEKPRDSVEETSATAERQAEGPGAERGQVQPPPPRRRPSRNPSVPSGQPTPPAPPGGKGRTRRQRVSRVGFPAPRWQRGGARAGPQPAVEGQRREGRPPGSQTLPVPAQPASKRDGQTLSPRGRSRGGQRGGTGRE